MIKAMTAATILINKHGLAENIKADALKLAELYDGNIQIQVDIKSRDGIALLRITEYNI